MSTDAQVAQSSNPQHRNNPRVFIPIPMTYAEFLPHLIQQSFVAVVPVKPLVLPYPKNYDPNAKCEYHVGATRHSMEKWWLNFKENTPNINNNPIPEHGKLEDVVEGSEEKLVQHKVITKGLCLDVYPGDRKVQEVLQQLMDEGIVQLSRKNKKTLIAMIRVEKATGSGPQPVTIYYTPVGSVP
ncbi:hypothetical protein CR513_11562, partial [Mucuna pruriens]